ERLRLTPPVAHPGRHAAGGTAITSRSRMIAMLLDAYPNARVSRDGSCALKQMSPRFHFIDVADGTGTRRRIHTPAAIVFDSEDDSRFIRSVVSAPPLGASSARVSAGTSARHHAAI